MTNRYELLIDSIRASDLFIAQMFLFALFALLAWSSLAWVTPFLRRPVQAVYLAAMLGVFIFVTVYSCSDDTHLREEKPHEEKNIFHMPVPVVGGVLAVGGARKCPGIANERYDRELDYNRYFYQTGCPVK